MLPMFEMTTHAAVATSEGWRRQISKLEAISRSGCGRAPERVRAAISIRVTMSADHRYDAESPATVARAPTAAMSQPASAGPTNVAVAWLASRRAFALMS